MVNCENCGVENAARYCDECVRVMQYEAEVHAASAEAERFEVEVDFEAERFEVEVAFEPEADDAPMEQDEAEAYQYAEFDE